MVADSKDSPLLLTAAEAAKRCGCSVRTWRTRDHCGLTPPPIRIGRSLYWRPNELAAGLYADFHSNRHTFITNLCRADVSPKTAQTLARHSDIRLTMDVYTHVDREEQIDAIRKLQAPGEGAA